MSRTARRNAKKRTRNLLIVTVVIVLAVLCLLAIKFLPFGKGGDDTPGTDNSVSISDSSTASGSVTDSASDGISDASTDSGTDDTTDAVSSESATDTTTDATSSKPTNTTTNTSTATNTATNTGTRDWHTTDENPGINPDGSFDFSAWNLVLVNPDNPVPEDYPLKLEWVSLNGLDRQVNSLCAQPIRDMVNAAKADGITLYLRSTYRGIKLQTDSFNAKVNEYIGYGYSREEATKIAATIVAVPGTSEHHTGLAADITCPEFNRLNENFDKTEAYKWLYAHCAEYGFILRYAKDKTDITKIIYEPWHYRYVGKEAAKIIMSEGLAYEEFVAKYGANQG